MSGLCQGEPIEFKDLLSPEQQALRKQLAGMVSQGLSKGATPYQGPLSVGMDPLQLMAANIMSNYGSGKGYNSAAMSGMPSQWTPGWHPAYQADTNMGGTKDNGGIWNPIPFPKDLVNRTPGVGGGGFDPRDNERWGKSPWATPRR